MHGLSKDIDLTFMVGACLDQVCIGHAVVILNFSSQLSITIESEFILSTVDGREISISPEHVATQKQLVDLLDQCIDSAENLGNGYVVLALSGGAKLHLTDNNKSYEPYTIDSPNNMIVV